MTGKAKLPSVDEVMGLGVSLGMSLTEAEAGAYQNLMTGAFKVYDWIERQEEFKPPVRYPRDKGYRPTRKENPYNAWFWKTEIRGAPSGPLAGLRVGVKDTICVAGVPMINGGRLLEGYVPDIDATVVSRLLDAGATIVGKTTVNDGAGDSLEGNSPLATVRNPRKPTHGPGGSSNGSAAALATGEIDLALGGDQGGSIRIPASWSGVVGLPRVQKHPAARRIFATHDARPLLRDGPEHARRPAAGIRSGARRARRDRHANDAVPGDAGSPRGLHYRG